MSVELERGLPNVYYPLTVSAELEWGLPNVYYPLTVSAELERDLSNVYYHSTVSAELEQVCQTSTSLRQSMDWPCNVFVLTVLL